ncbi:MAG TPA: ABC transporter ATP-binding protein [Hyphomicrobiaceae bacterium]
MLEVRDIDVYRGETHVLHGLELGVRPGEIVALIGANGAGKTTALRTISGLLRSRRGSIGFRPDPERPWTDITRLPAEEIVGLGISHCPEGRQIFGNLTVRENLMLGAFLRQDAASVRRDAGELCRLFPVLAERAGQLGTRLSGGEQMMLAIARALMSRPKLLLLDEPSLGLAPRLIEQVFETLERIRAEGTTVLLVEQNAAQALAIADRAYVMESGSITLSGTGAELAGNEQVRRAYMGAA